MNFKFWSRWVAVILTLSQFSCMKVKSKNDKDSESSISAAATSPGKVEVSFPSTAPNNYKVRFDFQSAPSAIFVTKTNAGIKNSEWIQINNQTWEDDKVKPGDEIHYEFSTNPQNPSETWEKVDAKVPQDLVIDEPLDFSQNKFSRLFVSHQGVLVMKQFARIYFTQSGKITLEDQSIQIEAEEIHSDYGLIQTFPAGAKAETGKGGRSGGFVEIKAGLASGTLKVEMRGENGGDGVAAKQPDAALKGAQGASGEPGTRGSSSGVIPGRFTEIISCAKQPTRGLPGHPGLKGYPGGNGQRGGSSGSLTVQISQDKSFSLLATSHVGHGGLGAPGGEGGVGGDGGAPGALPYVRHHETAECDQFSGAPGAKGEMGTTGLPGADGEKQVICELKNQQPINCN